MPAEGLDLTSPTVAHPALLNIELGLVQSGDSLKPQSTLLHFLNTTGFDFEALYNEEKTLQLQQKLL